MSRHQRSARARAVRVANALALLACARGARAEELAVFAGATDTDDHTSATYSWQIEYRQQLLSHFDLSLAYLNEGHLLGHHRDGASVQFWAVSSSWHGFDMALGLGPYFYFDTQTADSAPGFHDYHSVGELLTASLSYHWDSSWVARLNLSEVHAPGNVNTRMLVLGVGHSLNPLLDKLGDSFARGTPASNELGLFVGQTIVNSDISQRSRAFGIEYRRGLSENLELSAEWLNEADGRASHNGLVGEVWLVDPIFYHRATVGIGAGPYVALQKRESADGETGAPIEGMVSLSVSWRFTRSLLLRAVWDRGVTSDDQDRDVLTLGLSFRW